MKKIECFFQAGYFFRVLVYYGDLSAIGLIIDRLCKEAEYDGSLFSRPAFYRARVFPPAAVRRVKNKATDGQTQDNSGSEDIVGF